MLVDKLPSTILSIHSPHNEDDKLHQSVHPFFFLMSYSFVVWKIHTRNERVKR